MKSKKNKTIFNPPKFKCAKCSDVIWSETEGQYASCSCGAISVDYDRYMGRHIGNQEDFIKVEDQHMELNEEDWGV